MSVDFLKPFLADIDRAAEVPDRDESGKILQTVGAFAKIALLTRDLEGQEFVEIKNTIRRTRTKLETPILKP